MNEYQEVALGTLLNHFFENDQPVFLPLSKGKLVNFPWDKELFQKYFDRGVRRIFIDGKAYDKLFYLLREGIAKENLIEMEASVPDKLDALEKSLEKVKTLVKDFPIDQREIQAAAQICQNVVKVIETWDPVKHLFSRFQEKQPSEFFLNVLISHLCYFTLTRFDWANEKLKEKVVMGVMLCDLTLDQQDFMEMRMNMDTPSTLPSKIFFHPEHLLDILKSKGFDISPEIEQVVMQHHENFDGSGFPKGIKEEHFSLVGSLHRLVRGWVEAWRSEKFEGDKAAIILTAMADDFPPGTMESVFTAFSQVLTVEAA